jgi:hypothetical protein
VSGGTLHNCIISNNSAGWGGGGALSATLHNCTVIGNSAYEGGGAHSSTIYDSIITDNQGGMGSGVIACTTFNSVIAHNSESGGALRADLYNCIVAWNAAGVWESAAHNCTIALNGGLGANGGSLHNCIVSGNGRNVPEEDDPNGGESVPGMNMCYVGSDPGFVDPPSGDFRLLAGSPCIDAGADLSEIITNDLDGFCRPLDGNGDGSAAFDMGAYEFDLRSVVPESWFLGYGLDPTDPHVIEGNPDGDAHTTYQEWVADTDPTNALSYFRIEAISGGPPVRVCFQSSSNRFYTLHRRPELDNGAWSDVEGQSGVRGRGGLDALSDSQAGSRAFYRVGVGVGPAAPPSEGLVAYYPLDGDALDASGNGYHGTNTGVSFASARIGLGAVFDGDSSRHVRVDGFPEIRSNLTVAAWFKPQQMLSSGAGSPLVARGFSSEEAYTLFVNYTFINGMLNWNSADRFDAQVAIPALSDDVFYHVALVYDTTGGKVHIYLNGQSQGVFNYAKPLYAQTQPLYLGVSFPGGLEVFRGVLDEVRIYCRALNADEMLALYGAGR